MKIKGKIGLSARNFGFVVLLLAPTAFASGVGGGGTSGSPGPVHGYMLRAGGGGVQGEGTQAGGGGGSGYSSGSRKGTFELSGWSMGGGSMSLAGWTTGGVSGKPRSGGGGVIVGMCEYVEFAGGSSGGTPPSFEMCSK